MDTDIQQLFSAMEYMPANRHSRSSSPLTLIDLQNLLLPIGNKCFLKYYSKFADNMLSNNDIVELLIDKDNCTLKSARIKVNYARSIFKHNLSKEALLIIVMSKYTTKKMTDKALELLHSQ